MEEKKYVNIKIIIWKVNRIPSAAIMSGTKWNGSIEEIREGFLEVKVFELDLEIWVGVFHVKKQQRIFQPEKIACKVQRAKKDVKYLRQTWKLRVTVA